MNLLNKLCCFILAIGTIAISCTKNFEDINTDPNRIDQISPGTLLNPIIYNMTGFYMQKADDVTFNLMQVALPFPSASGGLHRYDVSENIGNSTWNTSYQWLNNIKEMKAAAAKAEDPNYEAIAMTLNAWIYAILTDCFGDVPMAEAVKADEGILRPTFNTQQDIYTKLLEDLETANSLFVPSKEMIYGTEILYANNVNKWKKFCNSLHMRLLLRLSKRTEIAAYTKLKAMMDDPVKYPVFTSNDDAAVLKLTGITPLTSPWGRPIDFTTFRATSKFFLDTLNSWNDPRREKLTSQAKAKDGTTNIGYKGIPSGYSGGENQFDYIPSNLNRALVTAPMICIIMPYAEVEFIKAEVEHHFNNLAASKTAYEEGVKAAMEQWGAAVPADYFSNPTSAFDGSLSRIMMQKYYALFFVDYQQWFEYRRTGFPQLPVADGMVNNQQLPVRFKYPIPVRTNNPENYKMAVQSIGSDDINTRLWWEK